MPQSSSGSSLPRILQNRLYLYLTEFFAGVSVMAVELGASRLLAPYFSSSQIVWTIIIGTIMIAMALGNVYGGFTADKNPDPDRLYRRIFLAAVWIAAIPVLGRYIILLITGVLILTVSTHFLVLAAFCGCLVLFVFPLFLLGTVTPSLVKVTVGSLQDSGRTVGVLGACNTIGSILGTFLPTFVTIPAVGTSATFLLFSGILVLLALVYFLSQRKRLVLCAICTALYILCLVIGLLSGSAAFWASDLLYEGESIYNYLQVREEPDRIVLSTNVLFGVQSVKMKTDALTGMYYDTALAAPVMAGLTAHSPDRSMLILGNGTGTYATLCRKYFDPGTIEAVEIDEKISALASAYFSMSPEIDLYTYDGRAYLQVADGLYDVILVDAYQDITIPFQMSSAEFFTLVREHLRPGGVMVVNMNMHSDGAGSINEALTNTIASVFPYVMTADVPGNTNRELFASDTPPDAMLTSHLDAVTDPDLGIYLSAVSARLVSQSAQGTPLTDDQAPVELLGMRAMDELISDELGYYKRVYAQEGLQGVLHLVLSE